MFLFRHSAGVRRLKALCVLLLLGLLEIPDAWAGVASLDWVWDTRQPLRGCFFGGDSDLRSQIAGTANEWTLNTGVVFDFGHAPNFNTCDARQKYDIRVSFDRPGFWGFVGTQGQRVAPSQPTVNISMQSADIDEKYRHKILQVFGHVLGFLHQEQDPQSRCRVDTAYIRQKFSISSSALEESVQVPNNGRYLLTPFDGRSVMRLLDVEQSFVSGSPAQCWEPEADSLSAGDHHLAQIIYPPRPSDIGISGGSGAIAVNFFRRRRREQFRLLSKQPASGTKNRIEENCPNQREID
jgi:hypothetical protein